MIIGHWWNNTDKGNRSTRREVLPIVTLSTTATARTGLGKNAGVRRGMPSTDHLNVLHYKPEFNLHKIQQLTCYVAVETLLL